MIRLTRLNGKEFILNAEWIRTVDHIPDTMITLMNGDKIIVKENFQDVIKLTQDYFQTVRPTLPATGAGFGSSTVSPEGN